jgi:hypothetical protein
MSELGRERSNEAARFRALMTGINLLGTVLLISFITTSPFLISFGFLRGKVM